MNEYGMKVVFNGNMDAAEAAVTAALKEAGFGILTRIDVSETLKQKIGVDRKPYVILGACNPHLANRGLEAEPELGLLLPCNVIVYESDQSETVVSIIDPTAMVGMIENEELACLVEQARPLLQQVLLSIS